MATTLQHPDAKAFISYLEEENISRYILIQHPPRSLSPNGRDHWGAALAAKQRLKEQVYAFLERTKQPLDPRPQIYYIHWFYKGVMPDDDNVIARCKYARDAIAEYWHIDDRTMHVRGFIPVNVMQLSAEKSADAPRKERKAVRDAYKSLAGFTIIEF
jgi:hypothetical protein